jgi:uncharacterized protein (TIGR02145 family)
MKKHLLKFSLLALALVFFGCSGDSGGEGGEASLTGDSSSSEETSSSSEVGSSSSVVLVTPEKEVIGIAVRTQPGKLEYAHGETLDLSGLAVRFFYDDGTSESVAFADFAARNIETEPPNGETLLYPSHNGTAVSVEHGGLSASTASLGVFLLCGEEKYDPAKKFCDARDDKLYKHVTIGSQTWMAENLNHAISGSKCGDDAPIEGNMFGNFGYSDGDTEHCRKYGRLYSWNTAMEVCPEGWHLPSYTEWETIEKYVDPNWKDNNENNVSGKKLKASSGWVNLGTKEPGNGTDDFGFAALPGGYGGPSSNPNFYNAGYIGWWWTSTPIAQEYAEYALYIVMNGHSDYASQGFQNRSILHSVRCVKD